MRLALDPRAKRLLRRLPRVNLYRLAELLLLLVLAVQAARLLWAVVTPVGPLGAWAQQDGMVRGAAERRQLLGSFDPFFRQQAGAGEAVVTSLQLTLFGVRVDEAMGRGSAIIAGPDGVQNSYGVGDEIMPGVVLKSVQFDSVTIQRGGADEQIFLDQSAAAPPPPPDQADTSSLLDSPAGGATRLTPQALMSEIDFAPRMDKGQVSGFVVKPKGDGNAFRLAGLQDGDIIVAVNNRKIANASDLEQVALQAGGTGGNVSLSVERGSQIIPIAITIARQ